MEIQCSVFLTTLWNGNIVRRYDSSALISNADPQESLAQALHLLNKHAEAAISTSDDLAVIKGIFCFRLFGSFDSLYLTLQRCNPERLKYLYGMVTDKPYPAALNRAQALKCIEAAVVRKPPGMTYIRRPFRTQFKAMRRWSSCAIA